MEIIDNLDLTAYNSYRVYSTVNKAFFPESEHELITVLKENPHAIVIGGGCNIVFSKTHYDVPFIILRQNFSGIRQIGLNTLECLSGTSMSSVSLYALEKGLSGFELFYDIPGTVGGGVFMNAGAKGEDIAHLLQWVKVVDTESFEIKLFKTDEIGYDYRNSIFQDFSKYTILSAAFILKVSDREGIREKMENNKKERAKKQPREYPNAGSVFKRPEGFYVGAIIEDLNLKGTTIGDAQISTKHGGFIINKGHATGNDIVELINKTKKMIDETYNIDIQIEQRII